MPRRAQSSTVDFEDVRGFGDLGRAHHVGCGERTTPGRETSTRRSMSSGYSCGLVVLSAHRANPVVCDGSEVSPVPALVGRRGAHVSVRDRDRARTAKARSPRRKQTVSVGLAGSGPKGTREATFFAPVEPIVSTDTHRGEVARTSHLGARFRARRGAKRSEEKCRICGPSSASRTQNGRRAAYAAYAQLRIAGHLRMQAASRQRRAFGLRSCRHRSRDRPLPDLGPPSD